MSADKEQEYFADGISEELLNLLAQVPELRVIARTSSFSFKGKDVDIAEIARRLNVANVLEGSVRKSGDTMRITAQLVRASDSSHLWSQTYDRPMTDIFAVQDEIAAAVVEQLKIKLLAGAPKARPTSSAAYEAFLKARVVGRQYTRAGFEEAIAVYQRALALDPSYAAAWEGLAYIYCEQAFSGLRPVDEAIRLAREALTKALAADPEFAPAFARFGWIAVYHDLDWAAAAQHVKHALQLDPTNPDTYGVGAQLARRLGRLDQAAALSEHQVSRDPANPDGLEMLAYTYRYAGRLDEAIAMLRTALSVSPEYIGGHEGVGELLLEKGKPQEALDEIQKETTEESRLVGLALAYHALGRKADADAALTQLISKHEETKSYRIAYVLAFRGEADRAFEWLGKAFQYRDLYRGTVAGHPMFRSLHSDPRWLPFLRSHGMAPEQLAAIKFDVKMPN